MMEAQPKPWGKIYRVYDSPRGRVEPIEILPGGFSSRHRHSHQDNLFVLVDGAVDLRIFDDLADYDDDRLDSAPFRTVKLRTTWATCMVSAGCWHQFYCHTQSRLVEVYFPPDIDAEDIQRRGENGCDKLDE